MSGHLCVIESFDPARHDRTGFSCGVAAVDNYFKKSANKLAKAGNVKLFVMVGADQALIFTIFNNLVPDWVLGD